MGTSVVERLHARHNDPLIMVVVNEGAAVIPGEDAANLSNRVVIVAKNGERRGVVLVLIKAGENVGQLMNALSVHHALRVNDSHLALSFCGVAACSSGERRALNVVDDLDHGLSAIVDAVKNVVTNGDPNRLHLTHGPGERKSVPHTLSAEGGSDGVGGDEVDAVGVHVWAPFRLVILFIRRPLTRVNTARAFSPENFTAPTIAHA